MNKGRKPIPKKQKSLEEGLNTPYQVDGMYGGILTNPNDSDYDKDNRGNHKSFKGDNVKPFSVSLMDMDTAVYHYITNIIKPTVYQNKQKINVPVLYGTSERWKQIQKDGYLRDGRNQIMLPLILYKRTSIEPNRNLANKIDANNPHNYNVFTKHYSKKNAYDNFSVLTNKIPEKEYHSIVVPDYVTLTYEFIVATHFVEQMNPIIEAINYASDSYWGDPERYKFKSYINSFTNTIELPVDGQRIVKTTFSLTLNGYIVPQTIQKDLNSVKKFNNKTQVIFGLETIESYESLIENPPSSFTQVNTIFSGNESCAPVLIYRNGVLFDTIAAGGTFSYDTGSGGNPIDVYINSQSFLTDQISDIYLPVVNRLGVEVGSEDLPNWAIENSTITINNTYYTAAAAENSVNVAVVNTNNTNVGFVSGAYFRIRDVYNRFNSSAITGTRAETTKSIDVIDEFNSDPIGTKETDTYTNLTIRVKNAYVSNSNGTYTASIIPGNTGSIRNTYVNVSNSLNTTIYQASLPSGVTNSFYVPNAKWEFYNTSGSLLETGSIASGATGSITASDVTIEIYNQGTLVSSSSIVYSGTGSFNLINYVPNTYITNSNGTYSQSIPAATTASIPNTYVNVYNASGSFIQTASIASCVTNSIYLTGSIIYIRPMSSGVSASFLTGDEYYNIINKPAPSSSLVGIHAFLNPTDPKMLINNNVFGHKHRFTGISGGYYDYSDSQYKLSDGTVSDQATTFGTTAAQTSYLIDNHTGLGWKWNVQASSVWSSQSLSASIITHSGFTDWFMPNVYQYKSLHCVYNLSNSLINLIPFNTNATIKTSTPNIGFETTQHHHVGIGAWTVNRGDGTADPCYFCRWHF